MKGAVAQAVSSQRLQRRALDQPTERAHPAETNIMSSTSRMLGVTGGALSGGSR
jgi:hypothetical protein